MYLLKPIQIVSTVERKSMHIAILTDGITPFVTGGMQRHSYHLIKNLLNNGVGVTLFHCVYDDNELPTEEMVLNEFGVDNSNLQVLGFKFPSSDRFPGHYLRASKLYAKQIAEKLIPMKDTFDFIYTKGFCGWELIRLKKKGIELPPISVKFHGYEMYQPTTIFKEKLKKYMLRPAVKWNNIQADYVFSYGGEISSIIKRIGVAPEKIIDICSGIKDDWIRENISKNENKIRKFLFIGRNEKRKGIQDLYALRDTIIKLPIEFHWIGPIPKDVQIDSNNCIYHGEIKDSSKIQEIIDTCDVLVTPSHSEGMPNVILEGMARGLAVIATKVGAVPMLVDSQNGVLIAPFDAGALQKALQDLANIDEETLYLKKLKSVSRVKEDFMWSAIGQKHIKEIAARIGR